MEKYDLSNILYSVLYSDWPFLKGLGSNFREGPRLGIGSGSMSRIEGPEGPEDLL